MHMLGKQRIGLNGSFLKYDFKAVLLKTNREALIMIRKREKKGEEKIFHVITCYCDDYTDQLGFALLLIEISN